MEGKTFYEVWRQGMMLQDVGVEEEWDELFETDQAAWNYLAAYVRTNSAH